MILHFDCNIILLESNIVWYDASRLMGPGCTYYASVGRDLPPKEVQFSEPVWDGSIFHCTNSGKGLKYTCLEGGPFWSGKGLLSYLSLELEYHK